MRKIIAILVGLLMLFSIPALGEEIDITDGVYREGQELGRGIYSFRCKETTNGYCVLATFESEEKYNLFAETDSVVDGLKDNSVYYCITHMGETCSIHINDGYLLLVKYGNGTLSAEQLSGEKEDTEDADSKESYDALLSILRSTEVTSGEKLMARIRYEAKIDSGIDDAIRTYESALCACGYSNQQVETIILKAQLGEEIHPFHSVEYDSYNMPAEQNGFANDPIFVDGVVKEYVSDGGSKNCVYGLILEQENEDQWLIYCAEKIHGEFIGKQIGSKPERHVFEGYADRPVRVYGKYLGFSEKYKLPVIDIVFYGGMLLTDENTFVKTNTSEYYMNRNCVYDFDYLIGAETCYVSGERYWIE